MFTSPGDTILTNRTGRPLVAARPAGWLLVVLILAGCGGQETLPELAPTAVVAQTPLVATPAATAALPTPTTAPTKTAAPTPTIPPPKPTPCQLPALPTLLPAWSDIEVGCPISPGQTGISTAYVPFEGGQMLWRGDNAAIYVVTNDGRWQRYDDLWREGDPEYTCGEASSPPTPVRGFGRVWCDNPDVREALGAVTAYELGDSAGSAQEFVNGTLLAAPDGSLFVFVGETATWRRVWPDE